MVAKKVAGVAGSAAGGAVGGFFSTPGAIVSVGIGTAIVAALIIFRNDIRGFFGGLEFPDINIDIPNPFENFQFPTFEFPDVGDVLGSIGKTITEAAGQILNPQGAPTTESEGTAVDFTESGMAAARGARGGAGEPEPIEVLLPLPEQGEQRDFGVTIAPSLLDSIIGPFIGGGPSFEGGTIFETPIENLSLNQIIERFGVSASEAASIRAEAIGFTPEEEAFLTQGEIDIGGFVAGGPPAVSDPAFEGLSAEEIVLRLTGGNISNF